jgi:chorismate mutase
MSARKTSPAEARLSALRSKVERTDDAIVRLLRDRMRLARTIGAAKAAEGLPVLDTAREARVVRHAAARARALGVPAEPVRGLFWGIIALCRDEQIAVRRRGTGPRRRHA